MTLASAFSRSVFCRSAFSRFVFSRSVFPRSGALLAGMALLTALSTVSCKETSADVNEPLADGVTVAGGALEGARLESGVLSFKGIPYAAPPVGELRWRPPQPAASWEGVRSATEFSPACWQPLAAPGSFYGNGELERSEDCLYLNVWTAAERADEARPVMVWIHGGGLQTGAGSTVLYDGENLASRGVVLVTINYRLGPMGFLAHPGLSAEHDPASSGNYGILDQIAALGWVKENVHHFGGDPERITIFGESAGSWSVNFLTASPLATELFQRAIGESGGIFWPMPQLAGGEGSAEATGKRFAEALGATDVATLRSKTPEEIYAAMAETPGIQFMPNTDGWTFHKDVYDIFAAGEQNDVDTIVGFNSDEGTALFAGVAQDRASYEQWLKDNYGDFADDFLAVYPAADDEQAKVAAYENMADRYFGWQMRTWARLQTETGTKPARMYYFSRVPPWEQGDKYGAYHASEILYVFDNFEKSKTLRDEIGPFNHAWEDTDRQLARTMSSYWINFATTGDPNGEGVPEWPLFDAKADAVLRFGDTIEVVQGVLSDKLDVFDAYYDSLRGGG